MLVYCVDSAKSYAVAGLYNVKSCIDMFSISQSFTIHDTLHFPEVEEIFCNWIRANIRLPTGVTLPSLMSDHNWLRYCVAPDLFIVCFYKAHIKYYLLIRRAALLAFRATAFNY